MVCLQTELCQKGGKDYGEDKKLHYIGIIKNMADKYPGVQLRWYDDKESFFNLIKNASGKKDVRV